MKDNKSKISNTEWSLVIAALLTIDISQVVLDWLIIGVFLNPFLDIFVGMSFSLYLQLRGQSMASPKRLLGVVATFLGEMIPVVDELPLWSLDGIFNMVISKSDTIMAKIPGGTEIAKTAGLSDKGGAKGDAGSNNTEPAPKRSFSEKIDSSTRQLRAANQSIIDNRKNRNNPVE